MQPEKEQDQYPQKLGGTMTLMAWILSLGVLTFLFSGYLDQQSNPNDQVSSRSDGRRVEVVLNRNREGHYVATALLNETPATIMIDTGATEVSVPAGIAARAGLKAGAPFSVSTANGNIIVHATTIDTIQLGELVLHNIRANINPAMEEDIVLLGMSFLRQVDFGQQQGQLVLGRTLSE